MFYLPFGYTYGYYILENDYLKLSALEKQNTMLSSVVLEDDPRGFIRVNKDQVEGIERLESKIIPDENIELEKELIKVNKAGAILTLEIESKPKSEVYVRLEGFNIIKRAATMATLKVKGESEATKNVNIRSPYHNTYFREDYLVNAGYSKKTKSFVTIKFLQKGIYSYDGIEVYNVDMNYCKEGIKNLEQDTLNNLSHRNNIIQGDIILDKEKVMVFSIPYSKGWKAYVNNEKIDVFPANIMHTAIFLEEGENHITLKYRTPLLIPGLIVSAIALTIFITILIRYNYKERFNYYI